MSSSKPPIRPSAWLYALVPAVVVLGIIGFIVFLVLGISNITGNLTQVEVPGTTTLHLSATGNYSVFYEEESTFNGKTYSTGRLGAMTCTLKNKVTGAAVPLHRMTMQATYALGGRSGEGILTFDIATPGDYDFSATYDDGATSPNLIFAIGQGFTGGLVSTMLCSMGSCFGSFAAALLIFLVVFIKRKNAANRMKGV
ncbi:MAG TPA: hypothetical protein VL860_13915 [Planctomycetota bacterium]|jgi:hypothetical protein|nr:hypothetical protein [Planctomycetota bacterium]